MSNENRNQENICDMKTVPLSVAFPQATPASIFPPPASDYYQLDDLLTSEEKELRYKVRGVMEKEVAPIMAEYWEKAQFPFQVIPKLGALGFTGGAIEGYGCEKISSTASGLACAEIGRVDASIGSFILVHSSLAMLTIAQRGTEEQKQKYLPSLARLDTVATYALTEPNYGSDASSLQTTATKVQGGWILNGQKRWSGNCTFANIFVVSARNTHTNQVNGFIVKKGALGLSVRKIQNKVALRMVQNGDIMFDNVFVADEDKLPGVITYQGLVEALSFARVMAAWLSIGMAMGVYDMCNRYLRERKQFGAPLTAYQITQEKLVRMLGNIQAMSLLGWRLSRLHESGKMTSGHASMGKAWITSKARETISIGRELLGGNGILTDFLVGKTFCDIEPIFTYEGTYDVNCLIAGREITGISSFKPSFLAKARL
ncbi:hypothetical protein LUZ60_003766 [Juncus effusus]|nr:hypothetical protein LUZ60_003766 [Juncus effusus]